MEDKPLLLTHKQKERYSNVLGSTKYKILPRWGSLALKHIEHCESQLRKKPNNHYWKKQLEIAKKRMNNENNY